MLKQPAHKAFLFKNAAVLGALAFLATIGSCGKSSETFGPGSETPAGSNVLVGAGDIGASADAQATAKLLDKIPGTVFTAGDNAYPGGSDGDFADYNKAWGRHRARTRPAPGNHDYETSGASGYFRYFGVRAGPASRGYYSYDLGDWHIISLNSNIDMSAGSAQAQW